MLVPTIGIEIHVELKSNKKVFSSSLNNFDINPNTNVSLIDLGYPGTLPNLNKEVIELALKASLALNCKINKTMHFDRKNYFYPDLSKGYQITQDKTPSGYDGYIEIEANGLVKKIGIERIHIEEDTCKSIHTDNGTLLNFNRAGVPLIEIVSKPDIKSDKEAIAYLETIREILLYLGISDVKIEEGSMRCDANISLSEEGSQVLGTKVEIKNIGSISDVGTSILYEYNRQKEILNKSEKIKEETRRFDDKSNTTILMRLKEQGNDYMYFPEPDIPFITLEDSYIEKIKKDLPILPNQLKIYYKDLGLNDNYIKTIISNYELNKYFYKLITKTNPITLANILTGDILSYINKNKVDINHIKLNEEDLIELIKLIDKSKVSSKQTKEIISLLLTTNDNLKTIIENQDIKQIDDDNILLEIINNIIKNNPDSVKDYKEGKDRAIKFLMGQIMKETKGQANPKLSNQLLINALNDVIC